MDRVIQPLHLDPDPVNMIDPCMFLYSLYCFFHYLLKNNLLYVVALHAKSNMVFIIKCIYSNENDCSFAYKLRLYMVHYSKYNIFLENKKITKTFTNQFNALSIGISLLLNVENEQHTRNIDIINLLPTTFRAYTKYWISCST